MNRLNNKYRKNLRRGLQVGISLFLFASCLTPSANRQVASTGDVRIEEFEKSDEFDVPVTHASMTWSLAHVGPIRADSVLTPRSKGELFPHFNVTHEKSVEDGEVSFHYEVWNQERLLLQVRTLQHGTIDYVVITDRRVASSEYPSVGTFYGDVAKKLEMTACYVVPPAAQGDMLCDSPGQPAISYLFRIGETMASQYLEQLILSRDIPKILNKRRVSGVVWRPVSKPLVK